AEDLEAPLVFRGDLRIARVASEPVVFRIGHAGGADDYRAQALGFLAAFLFERRGPGGTPLRMPGGQVGGERHTAQGDRVAVLELPIDLDRREEVVVTPREIALAARFELRRVAFARHHLRAGYLFQLGKTPGMVDR